MAVKIVIDTNIWVSALISPSGIASNLVDLWKAGKFTLVISEQQITELYEVLTRPKFSIKYRLPEKEVTGLVTSISKRAERVTLKGNIKWCRDPEDNMFIEAAIRGKAKYLITGDKDITNDEKVCLLLSQQGVIVTSLSRFLSLINKL